MWLLTDYHLQPVQQIFLIYMLGGIVFVQIFFTDLIKEHIEGVHDNSYSKWIAFNIFCMLVIWPLLWGYMLWCVIKIPFKERA